MNERQKLNFSTVFLYILLFTAMFSLYYVGRNGEPFGLALLYAMLVAGLNPVVSCLLYLLSGLSGFTLSVLPVYAGQAAILCIVFCVYAKLKKKAVAIPLVCVSLSLALFVAFSPFTPYNIPLNLPFTLGAISQKVILSGLIFLLSAMFTVSLKALLNKLLRCRLKAEEIIFSVLFFVLCGVGLCRIASVTAYMGIAFFILLLFACATKDASALIAAFALSLPPRLSEEFLPKDFSFTGQRSPSLSKWDDFPPFWPSSAYFSLTGISTEFIRCKPPFWYSLSFPPSFPACYFYSFLLPSSEKWKIN